MKSAAATASSVRPGRPELGVLEWFRPGEEARVLGALDRLEALGIAHLRTNIGWADWFTGRAQAWYDWLIPTVAQRIELLPTIGYTPPSLGLASRTSSPPRNPKDFADFIDVVISRYGDHFEHIELWNEPNNLSEWDWTLDPGWKIFSRMVQMAGHWAQRCGKKVVLGGMSPVDPGWLDTIAGEGALRFIDVVGIHGFPGTWELSWSGWASQIERTREVLDRHGSQAEVWVTEVGYSTWRHDERRQVETFLEAMKAPAGRIYWYALDDLHPDLPATDGFHIDEREYHFGFYRANGRAKLLTRALAGGGPAQAQRYARLHAPMAGIGRRRRGVLIDGGAGFIGTNLAERLCQQGRRVIVYDNLARSGTEQNAAYLRDRYGELVDLRIEDVRDRFALRRALERADAAIHLAAQVAVTTSLDDPCEDFEINAQGTLNLLEEIRRLGEPVPVVFTSTNKVYGSLEDIELDEGETRHVPRDPLLSRHGVDESRRLDFCSPYGCSKGAADQYVLDYARSFGLPTCVFRMSCIYGLHQHGNEDQGWIAHFLKAAAAREAVTLYGDGKQVRDALFAADLVEAFLLALKNMKVVGGRAFNIGGGPGNTTSLLELLAGIERLRGEGLATVTGDWRRGDQLWYVSDTRAFTAATGWRPRVSLDEGLGRLHDWLTRERGEGAHRSPARAAS